MDFYIIDPAGGQLRLPVNPEEVVCPGAKKFETVSIVNIGDIDFPNGDERSGVSFSSFFPAEYDPSYCRYPDIPDPNEAMAMLINWRIKRAPIQLLITHTYVNITALLTRTEYRYVGGEMGDIHYEIEFRQWRDVKVRTTEEMSSSASDAAGEPRSDLKPIPKTYTVKSGDSLWKIAKLELGNGAKYKELYELNKSTIGPDPSKIFPGQKLVLS